MLDDIIGERQVALALEALADPGDVQLQEVLRVAVEGLLEPPSLLVDFSCWARGALASPAVRFDGRMQTSKAKCGVSSLTGM